MDVVIRNVADLKLEIARLESVTAEQEHVIKQHFNSPRAILGTISSFFKRKDTEELKNATSPGNDITAWLSKFLLPLTLNKTLFRKSGFIVKALVGMLSQKASGFVNDKAVSSLLDKIKGVLPTAIAEKVFPKKKSPLLRLLSPKKS